MVVPALALCACGLQPLVAQRHVAGSGTEQIAEHGSGAAGHALTPQDEAALESALAAYDSGHAAEARPVLARLAGRYTTNATVQAAAGMTAVESGDVTGGVVYLQRAHRLDTGNTDVTENLGVALLRTGRPEEALPLLREVRRLRPADGTAVLGEAQALMDLKRWAEAATAFEGAATAAGAGAVTEDVRHDWAVALLNAGRAQDAVGVLQAGAGAASNAGAQELLGEAEEKLGHFQPAVGHFKRAAELEPSEANLLAYGNELLQHWTFPAAIEIFTYGRGRYPASDRLATGLGVAYFGNNDFAHAAEVFHAQLVARPGDAGVADLLGRSCSAAVSTEVVGCGELMRFAEAHPGNASANLYAAISLLHGEADAASTAKAVALLRQALVANPKLAEAWYQLAVAQQQGQQWTESAASLEKALALRPGYAEAHYRLARAYGHMGRKEDAAQQIALQQKSAQAAKDADTRRMQEVMTFLTASK